MKISKIIYYFPKNKGGNLLATCSVEIEGDLVMHQIRLRKSRRTGETYLCMPSYKKITLPDGRFKYIDTVHPTNKVYRNYLTEEVLKGYDFCLENDVNEYYPEHEEEDFVS